MGPPDLIAVPADSPLAALGSAIEDDEGVGEFPAHAGTERDPASQVEPEMCTASSPLTAPRSSIPRARGLREVRHEFPGARAVDPSPTAAAPEAASSESH